MVHPAGSSSSTAASAIMPRQRIDTLAIKAQLGAALGANQIHYWHALRSFLTAGLDRAEFEQLARGYLGKDLIHLHNALIMGILHNASPGVPGPSTDDDPCGPNGKRRNPGDPDPNAAVEVPTRKRQRLVLAGLPKAERQRIKLVGKLSRASTASASAAASTGVAGAATTSSSLSALGPTLSAASAAGMGGVDGMSGSGADNATLLAGGVGWAGANADMLERKRKEQEKRKAAEEKRRIRENLTSIGARDWRGQTMQQVNELDAVRDKLSASTQSAIVRALSASLCSDSKELPDIESLRDRMTLHAVEAGLPGGVHPQAAAMVLLALQGHIRTVVGGVISKLRARGTRSALSEDADVSAATAAAIAEAIRQREWSADDDDEDEENRDPRLATPSQGRSGSSATLRPVSSSSTPYGDKLSTRDSHTVKLSDMAMLLDLAPQTVVEPLGIGTQERLLAPEYEGGLDVGSAGDEAGLGAATHANADERLVRTLRSSSEEEVAAVI